MKSLVYVEIDTTYCSLSYGEGLCPAVLGVDSDDKCFNTRETCPVIDAFTTQTVTLRFSKNESYYPTKDIRAFPFITGIEYTPSVISLGQDMGQRASLKVSFRDQPHNDTGSGFDKYHAERDYDPWLQGTFWGKFRARQPYLFGWSIRLIQGYLGDALVDMETRHFIIESVDGPDTNGVYTVTAKDPLKRADSDKSQAPLLNSGFLSLAIDDNDTSITLNPSGVGEEYPESGHVAIGGKEIVSYTRPAGVGNDDDTVALLLFNGTDASTTITDQNLGGAAHTWTANGNAQLDTAVKKFGTASLLLDGTGDYVTAADHNDFYLGADDFTVDVQFRCESTALQYLCGQADSGLTVASSSFWIEHTAAGYMKATVCVGSTAYTVTGTVVYSDSVNTGFHHLLLSRSGDKLRLFIDGVLQAFTTISGTVNNSSANLSVGRAGAYTSNTWNGWIDSFRLSTGVARETSAFVAPTAEYNTSNIDVLTIVRAQHNTEAIAHDAQSRVQWCLEYSSEDPVDVIADLLENYAGLSTDLMDIDGWRLESENYLQRRFTAIIPEPTSVKKLIDEIIEQGGLVLWWDEFDNILKMQVLRAVSTDVLVIDPDNSMKKTLSIVDQAQKRLSQVWTYYAQINPLKKIDDLDNYKSSAKAVDLDVQSAYGIAAIKKIFSRWIPAGGRAVADRINLIQLGRFKSPPRKTVVELFRGDQSQVRLADGVRVMNWSVQDMFGAQTQIPSQIVRLDPTEATFKIECEEVSFDVPSDFNDRYIYIETDRAAPNIREMHDDLYSPPESGMIVRVFVEAGASAYATSRTVPALDIGDWPSGVTIYLTVRGVVHGWGGTGGARGYGLSGLGGYAGSPGEDGGVALYTRYPINLTIEDTGLIGGGGGGGGGGAGGGDYTFGLYVPTYGGNGGNGAGRNVSDDYTVPTAGAAGADRFVTGAGAGGNGGDTATVGSDGQENAFTGGMNGVAGNPGNAIDGVSYVTILDNDGAITGAQVN